MAGARPDTWMPIYWGDYAKDTAHLGAAHHGAYLMLIKHYWVTGRPLLNDDNQLWRIACADGIAHWRKLKPIVLAFFCEEDGLLHHGRIDAELGKATKFIDKQRDNGGKGGRPPNPKETQPETQNKPTAKAKDNPDHKPKETTSPSPSPSPIVTTIRTEASNGTDAPDDDLTLPILELDHSASGDAAREWNAAAERAGWAKVQALTSSRRKSLKARLAECGGTEGWRVALQKAEASSFLTGKTGRTNGHENWRFSFDFMVKQGPFTKLMEGGFDDPPDSAKPNTGLSAVLAGYAEAGSGG